MSLLTDKIKVSINNPNRITVRTVGVSALAQTGKLSSLTDVDASNPNTNEVLVYDEALQLYVVKTLPLVDGGHY
jgi:hypothetical protein